MKSQVLKGRYAIQKQLSKNAGRRTLLAQDLQTQEFVVIKLLMFGESFQWDDLKLFEREAQTLQRLSHPEIPSYLDYFDLDTSIGKGFALVQSYIPAKSLEQWLKDGRTFSEEDVNQPSDLYSLGATLIYLVTGRHPSELSQENLRIQFESSVNLRSDLIDWLKWMTQPSLNRRLASAGEAMKALEQPRQQTYIPAVRRQPFGSRIQVKKDGESVKILIPPPLSIFRGKSWIYPVFILSYILLTLFALHPFLIFVFFGVLGLFEWPNTTFLLLAYLFCLPSLGIFIVMWRSFGNFLNLFRTTRLTLNNQQIYLTYEWPWLKSYKPPIMKKNIRQLHYTNRYQTITIIATQQDYVLPYVLAANSEGLVDPEMEWLAHEISEWSGVPITIEN